MILRARWDPWSIPAFWEKNTYFPVFPLFPKFSCSCGSFKSKLKLQLQICQIPLAADGKGGFSILIPLEKLSLLFRRSPSHWDFAQSDWNSWVTSRGKGYLWISCTSQGASIPKGKDPEMKLGKGREFNFLRGYNFLGSLIFLRVTFGLCFGTGSRRSCE